MTSGRLAGLADVANSTADRRAALDTLAKDFAKQLNTWSATGRTPTGAPGPAMVNATGGAAAFVVLMNNPMAIAAASAAGVANGNLLALDALRGATGAEARWNELVSDAAQSLSSAKSQAAAASSWRDNSFASLDEVTGVDLDHEAAEMLRYQQAYSGATRIIQVARDTLNAIFELF